MSDSPQEPAIIDTMPTWGSPDCGDEMAQEMPTEGKPVPMPGWRMPRGQ